MVGVSPGGGGARLEGRKCGLGMGAGSEDPQAGGGWGRQDTFQRQSEGCGGQSVIRPEGGGLRV